MDKLSKDNILEIFHLLIPDFRSYISLASTNKYHHQLSRVYIYIIDTTKLFLPRYIRTNNILLGILLSSQVLNYPNMPAANLYMYTIKPYLDALSNKEIQVNKLIYTYTFVLVDANTKDAINIPIARHIGKVIAALILCIYYGISVLPVVPLI